MAKVEVEHIGSIDKNKFDELAKKFLKEGKFLGEKRRFSMICCASNKSVREVKDDPVDIKVRITNGQAEFTFKYGKWGGHHARKEYNFEFETEKFADFIEFLKLIGYKKYVLMANTKYDYEYRGIVFSLVDVPNYCYYFEAEILADEKDVEAAHKKMDKEISKLGIEALNQEKFYDLLDAMNNRPGYKIDIEKTPFEEIKERFKDYF